MANDKCCVCLGTGTNIKPYSRKCGACGGTGVSTAPWHQERNASTITIPHDGVLSENLREEHRTPVMRNNRVVEYRVLVSWRNRYV